MKDLLAAPRETEPRVTTETFLARIAADTSKAFADRLRAIVVDGAVAVPDTKLLEPCLHGHVEQVGPFEVGFDEKTARGKHVVAGVVPGSNAHRAGLRNGQRIASFKMRRGEFRWPLEAMIEEGGASRIVTYSPQGKNVPVGGAHGGLPAAGRLRDDPVAPAPPGPRRCEGEEDPRQAAASAILAPRVARPGACGAHRAHEGSHCRDPSSLIGAWFAPWHHGAHRDDSLAPPCVRSGAPCEALVTASMRRRLCTTSLTMRT